MGETVKEIQNKLLKPSLRIFLPTQNCIQEAWMTKSLVLIAHLLSLCSLLAVAHLYIAANDWSLSNSKSWCATLQWQNICTYFSK